MPAPRKFHSLKQEDFDRLIEWLDEDRDQAAIAYEKIRRRLITILASRDCPVPEELADETIDRVARRVVDIRDTYVGDKSLYFLGVANNVHHEYLKRPPILEPPRQDSDVELKERTHFCLEHCVESLPDDSRHLIKKYYAEEKQAKIDLRKHLADEMGISISNLRLRALRIREKLQGCIELCLST